MKERSETWIRLRLSIVLFGLLMLLSVAGVRAYQLQILKQTELFHRAACQNTVRVDLRPFRGAIADRHGHELAVSIEVDSVYAHPWQIGNPQNAVKQLGDILKVGTDSMRAKLTSSSRFVWLERGITPGQREQIETIGITGINFVPENKRYYPQREIAGHLLGFVNIDGKGLEGVELRYDSELTGGPRQIIAHRDARGKIIMTSACRPYDIPRGNNLTLTLDLTIQHILERELQKAVEKAEAKGGMGIVMDPKTGEILGLAVQPSFNPNNFRNSTANQWRNRAVTDCFDPGSTFKTFFAAAALEEDLVSPEERIDCESGSYRVGRRTIHDVHKYQMLTFREVIKLSSNIGVTKVSERMEPQVLHSYIRKFGFGEMTGVDVPLESAGLVRPYQEWKEIDQRTITFGQGISVTALQLINGLCAIANGGYLMRPYVVKTITDEKGNCLKESHPVVVRKVLSEETARIITDMLIGVVEKGGTGTNAALSGVEVAGKTGTAQKVDPETGRFSMSHVIGSFMGFVPARSPRIAILIAIDEPKGRGFGGVVAAPAFKEVAQQVLTYLNVVPEEDPSTMLLASNNDTSNADVRSTEGAAVFFDEEFPPDCIPNFAGLTMRRVLQLAQLLNLEVRLEGTGKAVSQQPKPGTPLKDVSSCQVIFGPVM